MAALTKTQLTVIADIEVTGYALLDTKLVPSAARTARGLYRSAGISYLWSGRFIAMARTQAGASMAHAFANNRHRVARFDAYQQRGNDWAVNLMLKGSL